MRHPVNQVKLVIEKLKEDRNSRQATIMLGDGNCLKEESPACCRIVDFKIRDNLLNMFLLFRSHDITAYYPNLRAFAKLQEFVSNEVGVEIGVLGVTSESLHLYEGDCDLIGWERF
jgi:thymidylate synthase